MIFDSMITLPTYILWTDISTEYDNFETFQEPLPGREPLRKPRRVSAAPIAGPLRRPGLPVAEVHVQQLRLLGLRTLRCSRWGQDYLVNRIHLLLKSLTEILNMLGSSPTNHQNRSNDKKSTWWLWIHSLSLLNSTLLTPCYGNFWTIFVWRG